MLAVIIGFGVFLIFARLFQLPRMAILLVACLIVIVVVVVHLSLPNGHPLREGLGRTLYPWGILFSVVGIFWGYRAFLQKLRSIVAHNNMQNETQPIEDGRFSDAELERYSRHIILHDIGGVGQKRLRNAKVLVIGAGGLGSPIIQYLAAAGVGTIGVIDDDVVDISNLQRQVIHFDSAIGKPKVQSAQQSVMAQNPFVKLNPYERRLTEEIAQDLFSDYDIIVDGSDNFETRYLANKTAVALKKPLVSGALSQWEGQISIFDITTGGPCYQCVFPKKPADGLSATCAEAGVFAPLAGVVGTIMASETVKYIVKAGRVLNHEMIIYDALYAEFRAIRLKPNSDCPLCSQIERNTHE